MANIATTAYKIAFDDRKAAQEFDNTLQQLGGQGCYIRLCELAEHYGVDYEKQHISVRGSIYFYEMDERNSVLTIETESAWTGCHELFDALNEKLGYCMQISYRCVECGCEIYEVRDFGGFFPEECLVSASGEPFEEGFELPFETTPEAVDYWCDKMDISRDGRTDEEMLQFIENYEYEDDNTYFYIHLFEFV